MGGTNFTIRSLEGLQKYLKEGGIAFYLHKKPELLDSLFANNERLGTQVQT